MRMNVYADFLSPSEIVAFDVFVNDAPKGKQGMSFT